jgi:molybdenum cofactor cytidylyltransferase
MIAAIILAAGESSRMGHPKALLPYPFSNGPDGPHENETTFLERLIDVFERSRAAPIVVVLGHEPERIESAIDRRSAHFVRNESYREGMLSSIRAGLGALDEPVSGALVLPVDHPDVSVAVVDRLIEAFESTGAPIVLPVHAGRRGHPVLFSRALFDELRGAPDTVGARQVVWDHQEDLLEVEVQDPGIRRDVDTPGDYRSLRKERNEGN